MKVAFVLATLKFLNYCLYTLIVPFFPLILAHKGIDETWIGYIFSAYPLSSIICTPIIGGYITLIGRKKSLLIGCVISVLYSYICINDNDIQWIGCMMFLFIRYIESKNVLIIVSLIARLLQGIANALTQPTCKLPDSTLYIAQSILMISYQDRITKAMSIMEISGAIGASCGPFIGSSLNYLFGYEGPFICFAILYIQIFIFLASFIPSDQKIENKIIDQKVKFIHNNLRLQKQCSAFQVDNMYDYNLLNYNSIQENQDLLEPLQEKNIYQKYFRTEDIQNNNYIRLPYCIPNIINVNENSMIDSPHRPTTIFEGEKKISQLQILFKNGQIFSILMTFYISTTLWVYIEPILALYITIHLQLNEYMAPLFFLVFSCGYLLASFLLFNISSISQIDSKTQSVFAFFLAGISQLLIALYLPINYQIISILLGLFLFGLFSTFTLVPIYNQLLKSLDKHFDFLLVSKQQVIDMSSSLSVLLKSIAQVIAPIISVHIYSMYGFSILCMTFAFIAILYGLLLQIIL